MKKSLKWLPWILGLSILGLGTGADGAVNIYLRSGTTTCIYSTNSSQTLQGTSGTNQAGIVFSAKTNTFSFYSATLTNSVYISSSRTAAGTMGVQNNGNADFQFQASETLYDYNPVTGSQVQIVAGSASSWVTVAKNGKTGHASLPGKSVGGSGYTMPAGHMLKAIVTVVVNLSSGINGALIYNASGGDAKSLVQFPKTGSLAWPFGKFTSPPDATIVAPASVTKNSTNNIASVRDAGVGAVYSWTISNGIITAGQNTRQITWTAGSAGSVSLSVTVMSGCSSSGSASVVTLNGKANQTITFNSIAAHTYGDVPFTLIASASSGLPVTFTIVAGPASVSGNTLTMTGAGTVIVDATQAGDASYNPAITEQSFIVAPKAITVSGITASSKVYDGTTDAALDTNSASLTGVVAGDVVALDFTFASGDFADETVGSGKTVNISGLDIVGVAESKYLLIDPTTTADITAAELTVSGVTASDKVYDGTAAATLDTGSATLVGVFGNDIVTLDSGNAAGTFATKNVGAAQAVAISGLVLGGADAGNYTLTQPAAMASITARTLTVIASAANKVYDGTTAATTSLSDNRVAGDILNMNYVSASFSDKNVGNGKTVSVGGISVSGTDAGNYSFNASTTTTANITAVTVAGSITASSKVYDGTTAATIATRSLSGALTGDSVGLSGGSATFDDKNAGTGKIVTVTGLGLGGADAGNYTLASTSAATIADITTRSLTVSATGINKIYDGTTAASVTLSDNRLAGDDLSTSYTSADFTDQNVGSGKTVAVNGLSVGGLDAGNYTFNTSASASANIAAATLTITAAANTKAYDGTTSASATPTVSGLLGSDTVTGLAETYDTKDAGTGKTLSVSAYTVNDANNGNNYAVSTVASTDGVIDAATLTITATVSTKTYDGSTSATAIPMVSGLLGSDTVTGLAETYDTKDAGTGKTLSVSAYTVNDANNGNNYAVSTVASTDGVINAATLTITATANTKTYDGSTSASAMPTANGLQGSDSVSGLVETYDTRNAGAGKTLSVSAYTVNDGNAGGNYTVNTVANTAGVILPAALTITAVPNVKTYDGTTSAAAIPTVNGLQGSDSVTGLAEAYDTKDAGVAKTLSVSAYTINDGNAGGNYTVNTVGDTNNIANNIATTAGVIAPATLTVTVDNKSKLCGQANPPLTASYSGFVPGENAGVLTSPVVLATTGTTSSGVGNYPITADGATASNYTINYVNGVLTVNPALQLTSAYVSVNGNNQFIVSWMTVTGMTYQLEYKGDLNPATGWTPLGSSISGTGDTVSVTNSVNGIPHGFFRVGVQ